MLVNLTVEQVEILKNLLIEDMVKNQENTLVNTEIYKVFLRAED